MTPPNSPTPEWRALLALAGPLIVARAGHITMSLADTLMAGWIDEDAVAALALGSTAHFAVSIFAMGVLMGLDPMVSQAVGAEDTARWRGSLGAARWVALALSVPLMAWSLCAPWALAAIEQPAHLIPLVRDYLWMLAPAAAPMLFFQMYSNYLTGHGRTREFVWISLLANAANIVGNIVLAYGAFGLPAMGLMGIGLSTTLCTIVEWAAIRWVLREGGGYAGLRVPWGWPDRAAIRSLLRLGVPVGLHYTVEVSGFAFAALLMGWISAEALASHQIAINVASFSFTIALGVSGAAAVRVGHALGRRDLEGVRRAGATALKVGVALALCSGLALVTLRGPIARLFGLSGETFEIATQLPLIAAFFQLADSTQAIAAGLLRGVSDTRTPAIVNAIGYWVFGLPLGALGAFVLTDRTPEPIWWGLSLALAIASAALIWRFRALTRPGARHGPREETDHAEALHAS